MNCSASSLFACFRSSHNFAARAGSCVRSCAKADEPAKRKQASARAQGFKRIIEVYCKEQEEKRGETMLPPFLTSQAITGRGFQAFRGRPLRRGPVLRT